MEEKKRRLLLKLISTAMIVSLLFTDLSGLIPLLVRAAEKQTVYFGSYYQEEVVNEEYLIRLRDADFVNDRTMIEGIDFARKNGRYYYSTPIEWDVLKQEGGYYLLISKKILDYHTFSYFWHESDMRSWLNEEFYDTAFSDDEKLAMRRITQTTKFHPYEDAYINKKDPQYIETSDYVTLLDENEIQNTMYGFDSGTEAAVSRIAYTSPYAKPEETADRWWIRGSARWNYGNLQEQYITSEGSFGSWYGTYSYGVRPVIKVSELAVSAVKPEVNVDFSLPEYDAEKAAMDALPDLTNLGTAAINGPEVTVNNKTFNLWKTASKLSIGLKDKVTANYDPEKETVELIIGLGKRTAKEIKTPDPNGKEYDEKWKETYKEIKSLVNACGHKTNRETWNKFQKTRSKLQNFDADAVYKVKGSVAGYVKIQMKGTKVTDILESGLVFNFEAGGSVKNPLFWVVYSEFGISGSVEGKLYVDFKDSYSYKGSVGLAVEPSFAVGANVLVVDVKGGLKGKINGTVNFPWKSFRENVNVSLSGSFFFKLDTVIPGLGTSASWNWPTLELYPEFGKVSKALDLTYEPIKPVSKAAIARSLETEKAITADMSAAVYENAEPALLQMDEGNKYLVAYLDEVQVDGAYQAKLVYRTGDGENWTDPVIINQDTVFDTAAEIAQYNNKTYVIYAGSRSAVGEDQGIDEIAGGLELYVSAIEAGGTVTTSRIGETGQFKYAYDLVVNGDSLTAIWAENSANDIMLEEGGTAVYTSTLSDGTWGDAAELFHLSDAIEDISAGVFDNEVSAAYLADGFLFVNGNRKRTGLTETFDSAKIFDRKVYLRNGGVLYSYDGSKAESTNVPCGVDYQVRDSYVYWIQQQNFRSEIYAQKIGTDTPMAVTNDDSYIGSFSMAGSSLAYTSQSVDEAEDNPYGVTLLKFKGTVSRRQAEVTNIAYDILDYAPEKSTVFTFDIANNGTEELHNIRLLASCNDTSVYSDMVLETLEAGESKSVKISLQIPAGAAGLEAYVEADETLEDSPSNYLELEKAGGNLSLEETEDGKLNVTNTSAEAVSGITLTVKDSQYGEVIRTEAIGQLSAGESRMIELARKDWLKAAKSEENEDCYYLYCEISHNGNEMELGDNNVCMRLVDPALTQERENPSDTPQTPDSNSPTDGEKEPSPGNKTENPGDSTTPPAKVKKPGRVTGLKVKNKKKCKVIVSWNWQDAQGFQIEYALNRKFTKKKKTKWSARLTKKTITKLKKGKKYYIRVRAYRKSSGQKVYGKWSKVKAIKIKF